MGAQTIHSDLIRGHIDTMILRVLLDGDSYGYEIIKTLFLRSGQRYELKEPSLYTSLRRLEKQGYIESYWGNESQGGTAEVLSHDESRQGCLPHGHSGVGAGAGFDRFDAVGRDG